MAKGNSYEKLAQDAAARIEDARAAGQQLTFLPDEPQPGRDGRPARGKGKATSQLRDMLAARGLRLPEQVLTEMAGMASTEDALLTAMAATERVLAFAEAGATPYKGQPAKASLGQRLATFQFVYTAQLRAAEALLPYGLGKVTPDLVPQITNQIIVSGGGAAPADPATGARDVTPRPSRIAPPPMPGEMQRNQGLADAVPSHSDSDIRTKGPRS